MITLIFLALLQQTGFAQKFDVEAYLKRIDRNGNGTLEENEMSGRTRDFIEKMGFNVKKPVSIKKVVSKVKKDRAKREKEEKKPGSTTLRVPGFAPDSSTTGTAQPVKGFVDKQDPQEKSSKTSNTKEYSESVKERIDDVMRRYDRDKNGILDSKEIKNARWGSPSPLTNDKNRDGRLTRSELAQRYLDRDRYNNRERNSSRSSSRVSSRRSSSEDAQRKRIRERSKFKASSSSGSSSSSSSSSSSRTTTSRKVDTKKYEAYVNGLMERYDTNKNGKFEKDELSKMRRPPKNADANKDGEITKKELLDSLTGVTKAEPQKGSASKTSSARSYRDRNRERSKSYGSSSSFSKLDVNQDGQIQMHEFTKEWTEKAADEFLAKDKNDDGIITQAEWRG